MFFIWVFVLCSFNLDFDLIGRTKEMRYEILCLGSLNPCVKFS